MMDWKGKRVVVTGGAGMVGSYLVPRLLVAGARVTVLDNFSRGATRVSGAEYIKADAGRDDVCHNVLLGADAVFNLAAEVAGVQFNQWHHLYMFMQNMRLLHAPLLVAAACGVREFLQVSSVCVYAPGYNNPAQEENGQVGEPVGANAGYSWAKRMGERVALWKAGECGMKVVVVRPSNIYGMRDYFDERAHVIPNMIKQVYSDEPYVKIHGQGNTVRELIYADDVAEGMVFALAHGESGQVYNLGTNGRTKINTRDLLRLIQQIVGIEKKWQHIDAGDTGDTERWSDCTKIEALGWRAGIDLETGLRAVLRWYEHER